MHVKLEKIRFDERLQNRVNIDQDTVKEYAEAIESASPFPAVTVFFDGSDYWLADGFHRFHAHNRLGILEINADVRNGDLRDAILFSVGVNATHGLKRSNADKRKAVFTLLNDDEWKQLSDREIARLCSVSHNFVSELRKQYVSSDDRCDDKKRTVTRNGKTYEQDTSNIGKSKVSQEKNTNTNNDESSESDERGEFEQETESGVSDIEQINAELSHEIVLLENENQKLRDAIATSQLPETEIQSAEEIISELRAELSNIKIKLQAVTDSRDSYLRENAMLKEQCKRQAAQLKRMGVKNNA